MAVETWVQFPGLTFCFLLPHLFSKSLRCGRKNGGVYLYVSVRSGCCSGQRRELPLHIHTTDLKGSNCIEVQEDNTAILKASGDDTGMTGSWTLC